MVVHTSAIVFRTVDYSESSKIVTLFTEEHGKLAVMVRGVKKPKSKFSGLMEVGNLLDVVYYYKSSRSVQTLSEASYLDKTLNIRTDFEKMATAMSAIELINQVLHEGEINKPVFELTRDFMLWLDRTDRSPALIFPYLQVRLAGLAGHALQIDDRKEEAVKNKLDNGYLNLESGSISDKNESSHSYKLSSNQLDYLRLAIASRSGRLFDIKFSAGELRQLVENMDRYFKFHIEGFRDRKSDAIFEQILQE